MINELWTGKDSEGNGSDVIDVLSLKFGWRNRGKPPESSADFAVSRPGFEASTSGIQL
jgi:hypothetical protein